MKKQSQFEPYKDLRTEHARLDMRSGNWQGTRRLEKNRKPALENPNRGRLRTRQSGKLSLFVIFVKTASAPPVLSAGSACGGAHEPDNEQANPIFSVYY